ncbi:MAG: DUF3179 domain-containing protein, partial [Deltaproteobacteria bacterium]
MRVPAGPFIQCSMAAILATMLIAMPALAAGGRANGFDLSRHAIAPELIVSGGPPKDGIPAIDEPKFVEAAEATFLRPDEQVVGVVESGEAKAYPLRILNWHEIVNDVVGSRPVAVSY